MSVAQFTTSNFQLISMLSEEKFLWSAGYQHVAGIDEVGRGPVAGPVTVAAVILPQGFQSNRINDSKKLTASEREYCYQLIVDNALAYSIVHSSVAVIEKINILQATKRAMVQAVKKLQIQPHFILLDAVNIAYPGVPQKAIIGGDGLSQSIAAASILAKVTRDHLMIDLDKKYPQYGFAKHKGYATEMHIKALRDFGITPVHRRSFLTFLET